MAIQLPAGSPRLLRRLNSTAILRVIRTEGPISRTELARVTGLSKPTVNDVAESLLDTGYVSESIPEENGGTRRPGPRAKLLRFRSNLGYVLGIDIGANKILAVVTDLDGHVVGSERDRTAESERVEVKALLQKVRVVARRALKSAGIEAGDVLATGVGTPGVVDPKVGAITLAPQLPGLEGVRLQARLSRSFPGEILVDNEVHLSLLAEQWLGAARGINDAFYVQIGVGIGGGILIGGNIYSGAMGAAGEIGYLPLFAANGGGERLGAFEQAAGGAAFARFGRDAAHADPGSLLHRLVEGNLDAIDAETLFTAASSGDRASEAALSELLRRLARGIASAVIILNPDTVIVGGGLSRAGERLRRPLEQLIRELVPVAPQITLSKLGDETVALGGARLALNAVDQRLFAVTAEG